MRKARGALTGATILLMAAALLVTLVTRGARVPSIAGAAAAATSTPTVLAALSGNGLNVPKGIAVVGAQVWVANNGNSSISLFNQDSPPPGVRRVLPFTWRRTFSTSAGAIRRALSHAYLTQIARS